MLDQPAGRWSALMVICLGVVGVLATWFSATAIIPELIKVWHLSNNAASWLTNAVQLGFVVGALSASLVNLPDIIRLNRLMALSALLAAISNSLLLLTPSVEVAILLRFLTGMCLAGVYPAALKLMATWFTKGRGLALGFLIGALTIGSSAPHLFRAVTDNIQWQWVVLVSSSTSLFAAVLFSWKVKEGPYAFGKALFDPKQCLKVFTSKPLFLVNMGYFGHMWELYAMWAWLLAYANAASLHLESFPFGSPSMFCFIVVASGSVGCILGGVLSDRFGRCYTTIGMMSVSGCCALLMGFVFDGPGWLLASVAVIWGMSIIGDSAQFSAAVTELADKDFVGTALALQLGIGFALTVIAISILPLLANALDGWQWVFLILVPGPVIGSVAMALLRRLPDAERLAAGAK
ncbi:MFS transporter [Marinomonas sp. CT5]|uniref:MFS transporter n=1 Tax=Marinomonas sp. CT5 TaxID=2066133 RepID=UPI001BAF04D4|nr:MFS transporter [Marinomonas sp. CT5]QUX97668.1 MFS transporter [Marinomonas sp. CT5]